MRELANFSEHHRNTQIAPFGEGEAGKGRQRLINFIILLPTVFMSFNLCLIKYSLFLNPPTFINIYTEWLHGLPISRSLKPLKGRLYRFAEVVLRRDKLGRISSCAKAMISFQGKDVKT